MAFLDVKIFNNFKLSANQMTYVLDNKEKKLGEGQFSEVYLTKWTDGTPVVIKIAKCQRYRYAFEDEALFLHHLDGAGGAPKLIAIHFSPVMMVMSYLSGRTLMDVMCDNSVINSCMIRCLLEFTQKLQAVHQKGVLHIDIKADNVLVSFADDDHNAPSSINIIDFGNALIPNTILNLNGDANKIKRSPHMAPELWLGAPVTEKSDVYALGHMIMRCANWLQDQEARVQLGFVTRQACQLIDNRCGLEQVIEGLQHVLKLVERNERKNIIVVIDDNDGDSAASTTTFWQRVKNWCKVGLEWKFSLLILFFISFYFIFP